MNEKVRAWLADGARTPMCTALARLDGGQSARGSVQAHAAQHQRQPHRCPPRGP